MGVTKHSSGLIIAALHTQSAIEEGVVSIALCESGGIGRRAGFRYQYRKM